MTYLALRRRLLLSTGTLAALTALTGCGDDELDDHPSPTSTSSTTTSSMGDGGGGSGGGAAGLEATLDALRGDLDGTMLARSAQTGWPVPVDEGYLFVSTDPAHDLVAGEHDGWTGTAMTQEDGFSWLVLQVPAGARYKLTNAAGDFIADPWARSYTYDGFGEMSLVAPAEAHLDRYFRIGDAAMEPRTVRVWVPDGTIDRVLYAHDGQNLFDPEAIWGGWHLQESAPPGMLIVGIDNTAARLDEYTHVQDQIDDSGAWVGGAGDAYADFLQATVRPLIAGRYGEPGTIGLMGSSLGGLISLHVADRHPGVYAFAASLSGTMGWGSIGAGVHNETLIERLVAHGHQATVLYIDSGGGGSCVDSDGDGIDDDDPGAADNYCENLQLRDALTTVGYALSGDLHHFWEPDAPHNEAAWAARVFRPLDVFADL